jgi:microcystin-dependent protein
VRSKDYGTALLRALKKTGATGNGLPFSIAQPYLGVSFIIAVEGVFPSRN